MMGNQMNMMESTAQSSGKPVSDRDEDPKEATESAKSLDEFIAFRIRDDEFCISINIVREIRRWTPATRLPHSPPYLKGVVNLRGAVVPVIDFSARLDGPETVTTERHTIIIFETEGRTIGLLVDSVSDIFAADTQTLQPLSQVAPQADVDVISGVFVIEDRILRVVTVDNIIARDE